MKRAFSLIEVVLSLGLLSFCVVALLGLCSTGLKSGRKASDDTVVAAILWQEVNALRQQGASALQATNLFYDLSGQPTNAASAYYACSVQPLAMGPPPEARIEVTWPANAAAGKRPHTNSVVTTLPPAPPS